MKLLSFLKKHAPADVQTLIDQNEAHLAEARAKLPVLRDELDAASLRGSGDAAALAAVRSAENEVARLEHRADALNRAKREADAKAESERVEAIRAKAAAVAATLDAKLAGYGKAAAALAALCAEIESLGDAAESLNADLVAAGALPVPYTVPSYTLRHLALPAANDGPAYWTPGPRLDVAAAILATAR